MSQLTIKVNGQTVHGNRVNRYSFSLKKPDYSQSFNAVTECVVHVAAS